MEVGRLVISGTRTPILQLDSYWFGLSSPCMICDVLEFKLKEASNWTDQLIQSESLYKFSRFSLFPQMMPSRQFGLVHFIFDG